MKKSLTKWESYIGVALKRTAESTLETAKRINAFKEDINTEEFKSSMADWFGFGSTHLTYWSKIHNASERFSDNIELLPGSTRTLYELASIDDELWNELIEAGDIKPSLTVESTKNLKLSGGAIKALSAKYAEAYNFLDICNALNKIKSETNSIAELKQVFKEWIKLNPPDWKEDDEEPIDGEYEEVEKVEKAKPKSTGLNKEEAYALFGIYMDKKITNLEVLKLLNQLADTEELEDAIMVIRK